MTYGELIKAKDTAWREYMTNGGGIFPGREKIEAVLLNYRLWQQLVDNYEGEK